MPDQDGDKKHDPTQHRKQEARKQGQVAKSQDLGSALLLVVGIALIMTLGRSLVDFLGQFTATQLGGDAWLNANTETFTSFTYQLLGDLARHVLPMFVALMLVAILVNVAQVGFMFLPDKLGLDFTRLDPIKGVQRIFNLQGFMRLGMGILKIAIATAVAIAVLWREVATIIGLAGLATMDVATYLCDVVMWTSLKVAVALLILSLLDYAFQFWKHNQDLKMTDQELKEEMKNLEGDPQLIAKRKMIQRQLAMDRMQDTVPGADVVVTNPTELAIAIKYDPESMEAPMVVAKGAGVMAQRIRRLALEHNIPIVEKKPLAQALYKEVDVNQFVPADKYAAVAEILAYVYQLKGKKLPGQAA